MKALIYLFAIVFALGFTACKGDKGTDADDGIDSTQIMESADEETQRFLDQEGDIIHDETTDTLPAPEDLPDEEDTEGGLPPIKD